jgi:hypothetical protein
MRQRTIKTRGNLEVFRLTMEDYKRVWVRKKDYEKYKAAYDLLNKLGAEPDPDESRCEECGTFQKNLCDSQMRCCIFEGDQACYK